MPSTLWRNSKTLTTAEAQAVGRSLAGLAGAGNGGLDGTFPDFVFIRRAHWFAVPFDHGGHYKAVG